MTSNTYRNTLVASVATLIILLIDVVLFILRVGVLLGMMIPDMLILRWISHSQDPRFLSVMLELKSRFIYFFGLLIFYVTKSKQFS